MLVKDVMVKDVRTAKPHETIRNVAGVICTTKISGLPVVGEDKLLGFVSEKDILNTLLPTYADFLDDPIRSRDFESMETIYEEVLTKSVESLMTKRLYTVGPNDPVLMAASRMTLHGFRRIPVVEGETLVGLISLGDIHKAFFKRELDM